VLALVRPAGAGHRKKLEDAARIFARREFVDEEEHVQRENEAQSHLEAQFAANGIVLDEPVDVREPLDAFYLLRENLPAWQLFLAVQTEWRGTMDRIGLDKPGVLCIIDGRRVWRKRRREMFASIMLMERAVLEEWRMQQASSAGSAW
jgi:hypothetical protein